MAFPYRTMRLTFGGSIYADKDIWSNSINFGATNVDVVPSEWVYYKNVLPTIAPAIEAFFKTTGMISSKCTLEWIKLAYIGEDGKYLEDAVVYDYETAVTGQASGSVEAQRSLALTFGSGKNRGAGRFGRIYIPMYAQTVGTDGYISVPNANAIVAAGATLLRALTTAFKDINPGTEEITPIVLSDKTEINNPINRVRIGRLVDTMRSRRNKIKEIPTDWVTL